jgi:hypothetical protein
VGGSIQDHSQLRVGISYINLSGSVATMLVTYIYIF